MRFSFAVVQAGTGAVSQARKKLMLSRHSAGRIEMHQMDAAAHLDIAFDGRTEMPPTHFPRDLFPRPFPPRSK